MILHKPVLLKEAIDNLNLKEDMVVIDATLGGGGHSREILRKIGAGGILIAFDLDAQAIEDFARISNIKSQNSNKLQNSKLKIQKIGNVILVNDNFANLEKIVAGLKIEKVNAVLADLGWSSDQLSGRGMSFQKDEELDMRLDRNQELTAKYIVNNCSEEELGKIIREYGEERFWKSITKRIIQYRKDKKIETTGELAEIITGAVPGKYKHGKIHPATRTFQALRIETNRELENLEKFIPQAIEILRLKGRLAIITFHSLEDRIVKKSFRENARGSVSTDEITGRKIIKTAPQVKLVNKKPLTAEEIEIRENPKSRSAKLRVCEKL